MMPTNPDRGPRVARRQFLALGLASLSGCASSLIRGQNPDTEELLPTFEEESSTRLIGGVANAWNMGDLRIESIGLVTGLANTGSDPPADDRRQMLIDEMKTHGVESPNQLLASPTTSLVLVMGHLPPGVQKGDRFDLEVRVPSKSETSSLRGGWLMQSRLRQMEAMGRGIHTGHVSGLGQGHVLIDSAFMDGNQRVLDNRGVILGGGVSQTSRPVGLAIKSEHNSIQTAALVGKAINTRFFTTDHGKKVGVANPKRDNFVELVVPYQYRHNLWRYMTVIRSLALRETPQERVARIKLLERKLLEPATTQAAAAQLEAIGREALPALRAGLASPDLEVRFNAAVALAYMDDESGAKVLGEAARSNSAFRWLALTALSSMEHVAAFDALSELLHVASVETRYGAFRAMGIRNAQDPLVRGEVLGDGECRYHVVATTGDPMIHFARSRAPEIVVFGTDQRMKPPPFLFAGKDIMIKGVDANHVKVCRFRSGQEDLQETVSTEITQIIPAIVRVGGGYLDIMTALRAAKKEGFLDARVAIDAVPQRMRVYYRDEQNNESRSGAAPDSPVLAEREKSRAAPSLREQADPDIFTRDRQRVADVDFNEEERSTWRSYFGRMFQGKTE